MSDSTPQPVGIDQPASTRQDDAPWQRLHPLTPWLRNWAGLLVLGGVGVNALQSGLTEVIAFGRAAGVWRIGAGVLVVLALMVAYNIIWWRMARFRIGAESVELISGTLIRQHRSLRLDQLEAIDVIHPLIPRILGLAELRLEAAGGIDSRLTLAYLTARHAEQVRADIISRRPNATDPIADSIGSITQTAKESVAEALRFALPASDARSALPAPPADLVTMVPPPQAGQASLVGSAPSFGESAVLFRVPPKWTVRSYFHTWEPYVMIAATIALIVVIIVVGNWGFLIAWFPMLFGFGRALWNHLVTEMGFTGHTHPEGIRLTHGLTTQISQSIPGHRIQAIRLAQRRWWRGPDWWRVDLNVAGYGLAPNENRTLLVPVADPPMARLAISAVIPQATTPEVWQIVEQAMYTARHPASFIVSPDRARLFSPFAYARQGYARTEFALIVSTGWLTRTITIIPHNRIQAITLDSGPWERRRGMCGALLNSTTGPITARVPQMDAARAAELLTEELPLIDAPTGLVRGV